MDKKNINAYRIYVSIKDRVITPEEIDQIFNSVNELGSFIVSDTLYKVSIVERTGTGYFLGLNYGSAMPWTEEVVDSNTKEVIKNPRTQTQIELKSQMFFYYCDSERVWYCYGKRYLSILKWLIATTFNSSEKLISIIDTIDREEFLNTIYKLKEIHLGSENSLFTNHEKLISSFEGGGAVLKDFGQPYKAKISLSYDIEGEEVKNSLFRLFNILDESAVTDDLVIIAEDHEKCETIFKDGAFKKALHLLVSTTETQMLEPRSVMIAIEKELGK